MLTEVDGVDFFISYCLGVAKMKIKEKIIVILVLYNAFTIN